MAPEMRASRPSPFDLLKTKSKKAMKKDGKGDKVTPRNNTKADMYSLGVSAHASMSSLCTHSLALGCVLRDELRLQDGLGASQGPARASRA